MGRASPAIAAFNGGEMSPQMEGRTDQERYAIGTHVQQNFLPLKQGPTMLRSGTAYVQPVKTSANRSWLKRFEFSQTQAFILEFGDKYVRFYTNHGPLLATGVAAYNGGTAYVLGNLVLLGGVIYYCILPTTGNSPPNATYWYPLAPYNGSVTTAIYEIPSPYAYADLTDSLGEFALQIEQQGDVTYIAGGYAGAGYPPQTLTRYANNPPVWTFAPYAPADGPFSDAVPIVVGGNTALGVSGVSGAITINAYGGNVFTATDVGRLIRIQSQYFNVPVWTGQIAYVLGATVSNSGQNYVATNAATSGVNPPVHTSGSVQDGKAGVYWQWTDSSYGIAKITAYISPTQVSASTLLQFPANLVTTSASITAITQANPAVVSAVNAFVLGAPVFITGVVGMTQVNGNIQPIQAVSGATVTLGGVNSTGFTAYASGGTIIQNASIEWQLGAWSNTTEWPRALAFFKDRLFWAGKLNLWGSVPGLYSSQAQDFFGQQTTDAAMNVIVSGSDASSICWLSPAIILLIGTEGGEYGLDAAQYSAAPLGPSNVEVLRQSNWRCRHVRPELIGSSLLYVQRAGRKVFAMDYSLWLNRYDSTDQSKFSYHVTIGGITSVAYQQEPFSVLWATRADGTLLSYTFNREDQVTAWARHNLGGNGVVESIAVIPAPDGQRDELWMIVRRVINGATVRFVEYMTKHYEGPTQGYAGDAQSSCWYVDAGAQLVAVPPPGALTTTVSGLQYLAGQTVSILADGGVQPQQVVPNSGTIVIQGAFTTVTVGLPYQGNLVPMRFEGGADIGTAQGKVKQGANVVIRLVDSANGSIGQYVQPPAVPIMDPIFQNQTATALGMPPPIFSGDMPLSFPHNPVSDQDARDFYILVQQNDPLPMTVVGLYPSYKIEENQ